jgi:hypothetical protein
MVEEWKVESPKSTLEAVVTFSATTLASRAVALQVSRLVADGATGHNGFRAAEPMMAFLEAVVTSQRLGAGLVEVSLLVAVAATRGKSLGLRNRILVL